MLTKFLLLACAVVSAFGDGTYYATKTSKKNSQQPTPIEQKQYMTPAEYFSTQYQQPQQPQQPYMAPAAPSPYSFNYEADGSGRQESSDGSGKVTGSYTVVNEDGSQRLVKYIADEQGFRAQVDTDEPGTKSDSPANIQFKSAAIASNQPAQYAPKTTSKFSASAPEQKKYQTQMSEKSQHFSSKKVQQPTPIEQKQYIAPAQYSNTQYQQPQQPQKQYVAPAAPSPYSFNYEADGSGRQESSDGSGKVTGSYTVVNEDGSKRLVKYIADEQGFRAQIDTDEPGTKSDSPADTQLQSAALLSNQPAQYAPKIASKFSAEQKHYQTQMPQQPIKQYSQGPAAAKAPLSFPAPRPQSSSLDQYSSYASQYKAEEQYQPAGPYEFNYFAQLDDGSSSRSESSDGAGTITGSYNLAVADGRERSVQYIADNGGFRANIKTSEFGTKSDSPADTMFHSTATEDEPAPYKSPISSYQASRQSYQVPASQQGIALKSESYMSSYQPQKQQPIQYGQASLASSDLGPAPYSFDYKSQSEEGSSSRSESADASGAVVGSYSLTHADGSQRTVEYTADEGGFRAKVHTDEFGTKSDSPADVAFQSTAPLSAPSMPGQYSSGQYSAPKSKSSSQSSMFYSGAKFDGQQKVSHEAPAPFKTPSASFAAKQQPFQGVQQHIQQPAQFVPAPYSFNYNAEGSARQESSDKSGQVTGSYSVTNEDGSTRVVEYVADEGGFRAKVKTDEPGTKSDNPANVILQSSAPEPKPYSAPQPRPYSAPQQPQYQQPSSNSQFPAHSYSKKSSMISQEKIY